MNSKPNDNKNPWNKNTKSKIPTAKNSKNPEEKFKEAQQKLQAAVQKFTKDYESSEEEEELEVDNVIGTILKDYDTSGAGKELLRTRGFLEEAFQSGACTCLICISSIKRTDAIWSCEKCYCFFHLMCIQRWSKDTIFQQKQALEAPVQVRRIKLKWGCPKCRHEYEPEQIPNEYRCFCKKITNPKFQSLIVPHSCGETCRKDLQPYCGHGCLLLCHPGPCPPCPVMVKVTCFCGHSEPKIQRCSNKEWSCSAPCNKLLSCGKHKCSQPCHAGDCLPCSKKSVQKCVCGSTQKLRDCSTPVWQCEKVCRKDLKCGFHKCDEICHTGVCGSCKLSEIRTCPCGKSNYQLPCTEDTPTCGDTCGKVLECGMHICNRRCHKDKCSQCLETVTKSCRCGLHKKQIQCCKPYVCETKCKQMRDCNKHPCNKKCCDGKDCPSCEKPCGKTLTCRKHACASVCHRGPCYPCNLTETLKCFCGATSIVVPCGKKKSTKPPKCSKICKKSTECHHKKSVPHKCHFGDCPQCKQICDKPRDTCSHKCPSTCHSSVLMKFEAPRASTPWEQEAPTITKCALPCPNCIVPVPVTCLGGHETADYACYLAIPSSCYKPCKRELPCGNHTCSKDCHTVEEAPNSLKAGKNCEECNSGCTKPRPEGCTHQCPKPCHPGSCPPCQLMVRIKCHCNLSQPYVSCKDWTTGDRDALQSCGNRCPSKYPCGHQCRANCHQGDCPNAEDCKKKMKISCPCKRIKKDITCDVQRKTGGVLECDEVCAEKKLEERKLKDLENEKRKKEEEIKNQKELEKYEKMMQGKKKSKERKNVEIVEQKSFMQKYWMFIVGFVVVAIGIYLSLS
ncbi:PREDICTED: NF-X1-type zinc finger protein NFXL1 [Nicrophorus vespilloides]|uniref:NF-X1-type zinc finger protein NFXL1 n=1 Tax=Nicrophorus vespilloides TaxID=110193 RepID=A0ABM1N3Z9_NICVS|nr:PREDICTED: NF-X1-type zinc finger protein NFXL1 [Nicrophorus vespilloides]